MLFLFKWALTPATDLFNELLAKKLKYFLRHFSLFNHPEPTSGVILLEVRNKDRIRQISTLLISYVYTFSKDFTKSQ